MKSFPAHDKRGAHGPGLPTPTLDAVYREHLRYVWRVARLLGVRAEHLEDLVHDIFLVVNARLPTFEYGRPLRTWLFGITRNVVLHYRRDRARHARHLALVPEPADPPAPDEAVARAQAADTVQRFLDDLPDQQREAFVLFEIEGWRAREIADALGVSINTVFSRLRAARKSFERRIASRRDRG